MPHRAVDTVGVGVVAALLFAIAIAVTGCSSSGGHSSPPIIVDSPLPVMVPSPGSTASARIVESSDAELRQFLLKVSDMPAGWKQAAGAGVRAGSSCGGMSDPAYDRLPLHVEADFTSSSGVPSMTETLAYGSTAEVDAAWTGYVRGMASCGHFTVRMAGQALPLVLTQMPFPRTGVPTDAREAVTTAGGRAATVYFVVSRKEDLVESVTYADWGSPNTSEIQHLVGAAGQATAILP